MNFRNVLILAAMGLVSVAVAGFVPHGDDFGKTIATSLMDGGKILLGAALGVLAPQARVLLNGERASDPKPPPPTEGSERAR